MKILSLALSLVAFVGPVGCIPPCNKDLEAGRNYAVTLIERYDETSRFLFNMVRESGQPPCAAFDGLGAGVTIGIRTTEQVDVGGSCQPLVGVVTTAPMQTVTTRSLPGNFGAALLSVRHEVRVGDCEGEWLIALRGVQTNQLQEPVPGHPPPLVLSRLYDAKVGACRACGDVFVVRLQQR